MGDADLQVHRCECRGRALSVLHPRALGVGWFRTVLDGCEYPAPPCLPARPPVVVDVGANIGVSTLYFALRYPEAKVWAFEPSRVSFHCLRQNTAGLPNVTPVNVGLFSADRRAALHHGLSCVTDSVVRHCHSTGSAETIELRRASDLLAGHLGGGYISILKVDTEGCEVPILADLAGWYDRIDCLYYEYHSDEDRVELDRRLSGQFYVFHARPRGPPGDRGHDRQAARGRLPGPEPGPNRPPRGPAGRPRVTDPQHPSRRRGTFGLRRAPPARDKDGERRQTHQTAGDRSAHFSCLSRFPRNVGRGGSCSMLH